jgi:hypothetical protein
MDADSVLILRQDPNWWRCNHRRVVGRARRAAVRLLGEPGTFCSRASISVNVKPPPPPPPPPPGETRDFFELEVRRQPADPETGGFVMQSFRQAAELFSVDGGPPLTHVTVGPSSRHGPGAARTSSTARC